MKVVKKVLSPDLYRDIVASMPVATVDFIVVNNGKFLLGKRTSKPAQGQWWIPGGRVLKGETQAQAVKRKLKQETGLTAKSAKFIGVFDFMFDDSAFGISSHSISLLYLITPVSIKNLYPDAQNRELRWFAKIDSKLHPTLKKQLRLAGFR